MTIQIKLRLSGEEIPKDYRRLMLHFIKTVLESEDEKLFDEYYSKDSTIRKPFTFWANLGEAKFLENSILIQKKEITMYISSDNTKLSFLLYNGFKRASKLTVGENGFAIVQSVKLRDEKEIRDGEIIINMLSPLVVRKHLKGDKDRYLLFNEDGFDEWFKTCISSQLKSGQTLPEIVPIKCKKVIVQAYGTKIPSTLGIFKLSGDIEVLKKLYLIGMGSKNAAGFGKFEIIG